MVEWGALLANGFKSARMALRVIVAMSSDFDASDKELLSVVADGRNAGRDKAMLVLIERHLPSILTLARRMVGQAEADDIAQEVMFRLWQKAADLELDTRGARPWLYRVASNLCLDQLRKRRELTGTELPERSMAPDQDRQLNEQYMTRTVEDALNHLPERQKLALALFHLQDMTQRETAQIMDVTEEALESLLRRARAALKTRLSDSWQELMPESHDG